jgi:hypothetical protein
VQKLTVSEQGGEPASEIIDSVMAHLATCPHLPRLIQQEVVTGGVYLNTLAEEWIRPLVLEGVHAMERSGPPSWDRSDYPLFIAAWVHIIFGHFTMAPILGDVLGEDPLGEAGLERQTRFLRKLAALIQGASRS